MATQTDGVGVDRSTRDLRMSSRLNNKKTTCRVSPSISETIFQVSRFCSCVGEEIEAEFFLLNPAIFPKFVAGVRTELRAEMTIGFLLAVT